MARTHKKQRRKSNKPLRPEGEVPITLKGPSIVRPWKKFLACSCSHGELADQTALDAIVKFRVDFSPEKVIHLGDWVDTTAWRSGARDTKDQDMEVADDIKAGLMFLDRLQPTTVFNGNHEHRWYKFAEHPNALLRHAAKKSISDAGEFIRGTLRADYIETYDWNSWRMLGNYKVGHGILFSEHAVRDHANAVGNCIFGHLHRQEVSSGKRGDRPVGVCVGFLGDMRKFNYADLQVGKFRWNTGWCFGEYSDDQTIWQLHRHVTPETQPIEFQHV